MRPLCPVLPGGGADDRRRRHGNAYGGALKERYQLVVIGAGPAGSYAAWTAAKAGLDVLLVERDVRAGLPLACAEAISAGGLAAFVDPDPSFIATDIYTLSFTVATGAAFTYRSGERLGYVLDRPAFDRHLAERAVAVGVTLRTSTYASDVEMVDNGPAKIRLETIRGHSRVTADFVIAADGVESMIGRMAGLNTVLPLSRSDTSLQYRVGGITLDPHCLEFCVGEKYSPDGYLWIFPKSDHAANVGLGFNPAANDSRELRVILDRFLKERYGKYTVEFECCGMVPKFGGLDIVGRGNLLLAGDAARTVDSLTGAGIAKALHTGRLAAETIVEAVQGRLAASEAVDRYRTAIDAAVGKELRFMEKAHRIFRKFTDQDWESLAGFLEEYLSNQKAGSIDPAAIIKTALIRAPRLLRFARQLI